jgi:NitT/TauT family transport system substrate-binding protein
VNPSRARERRRELLALLALGAGPLLGACSRPEMPLRMGAQVFPSYELFFLAHQLGALPAAAVQLVEMPTATASVRALSSGVLEAACLTLDEVLSARERGIMLTAVAVLDFSLGADALLVRPGIRSLEDLRGARIGVEQSAVGAVMLDAVLKQAALQVDEVRVHPVSADNQERDLLQGRLDAVIAYEPAKSRLLAQGARVLFSSAQIPGRIVDVLAVRTAVLQPRRAAVQALVDGYFAARDAYLRAPGAHAAALAGRLAVAADQVQPAFAELELPDRPRNRALFANDAAQLGHTARQLAEVMGRAGLLRGDASSAELFDGRFVGPPS